MFKLATIAALVAFLSACSSMPGSMTGSSGMSRTTMGAGGSGTLADPTGNGGKINAPN